MFITDTVGNLLFYNEPAEAILGLRFEDTGPMPVEEWAVVFKPFDKSGQTLAPEKLPLVQTLGNKEPASGDFWIDGMDEQRRFIRVNSYPIIDRTEKYLGAMAIFWECREE